jgi:hypothetical protein
MSSAALAERVTALGPDALKINQYRFRAKSLFRRRIPASLRE